MNEGEFSGGQVQPTPNNQGNMPEQSADTANQAILSSASAGDTESAKSLFSNSNSFDAPQGTISSSADPDDDGPSAGHLFGSRSRRGSSRRSPAVEAQPFVPNPNAPDFFNDAMASMTPAPQPRSNKNGLKIAIIAVVAILVIGGGILAAVLLGRGGGGGDKEPNAAEGELSKILEEGSDSLAYFDSELTTIAENSQLPVLYASIGAGDDFAGRYTTQLKELDEMYEGLKTLNTNMGNYSYDFSGRPDQQEILDSLNVFKSSLTASMQTYENIYKINSTIYKAFGDGGKTKLSPVITQLSNDSGVVTFANQLDGYVAQLSSSKAIIDENTCLTKAKDIQSCRTAMRNFSTASSALGELDSKTVCDKIFNNAASLSRRNIYDQLSKLWGLVDNRESQNE